MKPYLILAALVLGCMTAKAQDPEPGPATSEKTIFSSSYAVKWNPASLYFGKLSLGGEWNYKSKKSVTFGIGIPMEQTIKRNIDKEERELTMKTFSAMAGYRMYFGKKPMKGFYLEPYVKYLKNEISTNIDATLEGQPVTLAVKSEYTGIGAGAQLGVQFLIAKRVTIDFFFLGPEANSGKETLLGTDVSSSFPWTPGMANDAEKEISDTVKDIPIIGDKVEVKADAATKTVSASYKGFIPGIRGGLSFGIRF